MSVKGRKNPVQVPAKGTTTDPMELKGIVDEITLLALRVPRNRRCQLRSAVESCLRLVDPTEDDLANMEDNG